ncbi:MAG TPA: PBP1A family penicillin-binding protein [Rhizomicrobium sp.]|nr:PBP1A family penicillin-binding protein [Rhizomicrobium sp.]
MEYLDAFLRWADRHRGALVITGAIVATPLFLIWFIPHVLVWFAPKLDMSQDLYAVNRPVAFTFLDEEGNEVGHRGAIVGDRLRLSEMPVYLPAAFIAMEDRTFYSNEGISVRGLIRAAIANFRAGHVVAGGSTITQQTAKIVFLTPKRTYARKYTELLDAAALQKSLTKEQILELYLNRIYLGSGAYGVDGAAHVYFGKSARNLTLSEAAMLATLTRAPSAFSPRRDLAAAQERAGIVLQAMVETGAITQAQADDAKAHPAVVVDHTAVDERNYFLDTAADEALTHVDTSGHGSTNDLIVHTTLMPRLEDAARRAVAKTLNAKGRKLHASEAAVIVMKPDGAVAVLLGGRDYDESVFNRATQAKRQPGSAFKPFVYLAALENGISPNDVRDDGPVDIDGWTPTNYGGRSYGTVTLAEALAHSINTVTAGLAQEVGVTTVVDAAHRCGITSPLTPDASLALGTSEVTPMELTTAYATFASGGYRIYPYFVTEVDDAGGHALYKRKAPTLQRVVASHVNRDLTGMLYGVVTGGTGRGAAIAGHEAAGKTGTTQDYHDAWFVGFTADYVASVWVGNDDSSPMKSVTGGSLPATIWHDVMTVAERDMPSTPLDKSTGEAPTDDTSAQTASDTESGPPAATDDESGPAQNPPSSGQSPSFWNWIFGRQQQQQASPPANPQAGHDANPPSDDQDNSGNQGNPHQDSQNIPPQHQQRTAPLYGQNYAPSNNASPYGEPPAGYGAPPPRYRAAPTPPPDADDDDGH